MTANQLQYWRNVETERANRAQETTLESEIAKNLSSASLDYASADLNRRKIESEILKQILSQYDIGRQKYYNEQTRLATELQAAEQKGKLFEANVQGQKYDDFNKSDYQFVAGTDLAGRVLDALGLGLNFKV